MDGVEGYADEYEGGQLGLAVPGEQRSLLPRPAGRVRCEVCGELVTVDELARLRSDVDFVEHGGRGHLIRVGSGV